MNNDIQQIRQLYKDLCEASIQKDLKKLDNVLADNYILVHMTGMNQSKEDYINSVINEELKYYDAIHESIDVSIEEDKAIVIGKTKTLASPFEIPTFWWRLKQEMIVKKINGEWKIIHSKASTY